MTTVFANARIVDVLGGTAIENGSVIVEDGIIKEVGAGLAVPEGAKVVDLIFNIIRHAAVQKVIELQKIVRVKLHGAKIGVSIV